jgi:hypothetical protein
VVARDIPSVPVVEPSPPQLTHYDFAQLQSLWDSEGGNPGESFVAAEVACAESGGNPDAISPTDDVGLWQINVGHGSMASTNPVVNASAAIAISDDGTDWSAWTTFTSGAYIGASC